MAAAGAPWNPGLMPPRATRLPACLLLAFALPAIALADCELPFAPPEARAVAQAFHHRREQARSLGDQHVARAVMATGPEERTSPDTQPSRYTTDSLPSRSSHVL